MTVLDRKTKKMTIMERKSLNNDTYEQEKSEKGQVWKGKV